MCSSENSEQSLNGKLWKLSFCFCVLFYNDRRRGLQRQGPSLPHAGRKSPVHADVCPAAPCAATKLWPTPAGESEVAADGSLCWCPRQGPRIARRLGGAPASGGHSHVIRSSNENTRTPLLAAWCDSAPKQRSTACGFVYAKFETPAKLPGGASERSPRRGRPWGLMLVPGG